MRKLIYTLSLICSIIGLIAIIIFPVYKFDKNLVESNNVECVGQLDFDSIYDNYNSLGKEEKKAVQASFEKAKTLTKALMDEDKDKLFSVIDYEIINDVYKAFVSKPGDLTAESTQSEKDVYVKLLKDTYGEEAYNTKKNEELQAEIDNFNKLISEQFAEDAIYNDGTATVIDELFLLYFGQDSDLVKETSSTIREKGIKLSNMITSIKNTWTLEKNLFSQEEYASLSITQKIKAVYKDPNFYNPFPIIGLAAIYLAILIGLICNIFRSLGGIRGKRRPKMFIKSLLLCGICVLLFMAGELIPQDYILKFHDREFQRLLEFFVYGEVDLGILIPMGAFAVSTIVGLLGVCCRFGKRRSRDRDRDEY